MSTNQIKIGEAQAQWNVAGNRILKYTIEIYHSGLREHKIISAPDLDILENKVNLQTQSWVEKWNRIVSKRRSDAEKEANVEEASLRTEMATKAIKQIDELLVHTLSVDDRVDWESLKKKDGFPEKMPAKPEKKPNKEHPPKPNKQSQQFKPNFTIWEKLFKSKKDKKIQEFENKYSNAISDWKKNVASVDFHNTEMDKEYQSEVEKWEPK